MERLDNEKGYSPENCRWATRLEQVANRGNMNYLEHDGLRFTLNGWAKHLGISTGAMYKRWVKGLRPPELMQANQSGRK